MEETSFSISDVSKMMDVKAGMLRRWEDELGLSIPRNDLGYRYYRQEEIEKIQNVKVLRDYGFQVKAIKLLLPNADKIKQLPLELRNRFCQELNKRVDGQEKVGVVVEHTINLPKSTDKLEPREKDRMEQFTEGMQNMMKNALADNNQVLTEGIVQEVTTRVIKELNYQFRQQEEVSEEHFRKLDEALRGRQKKKKNNRVKFRKGNS